MIGLAACGILSSMMRVRWCAFASLAGLAGCDLVFTVPDRTGAPNPTSCNALFDAKFPTATTCVPGMEFESGNGQIAQSNGMLVIHSTANNECGCRYAFQSSVQQVAFEIARPAMGPDATSGLVVTSQIDAAIYIANDRLAFTSEDGKKMFGSVPYDGTQRWARIVFGGDATTAEVSRDGLAWSRLGATPDVVASSDFTFELVVALADSVLGDNAVFTHFIVCAP